MKVAGSNDCFPPSRKLPLRQAKQRKLRKQCFEVTEARDAEMTVEMKVENER